MPAGRLVLTAGGRIIFGHRGRLTQTARPRDALLLMAGMLWRHSGGLRELARRYAGAALCMVIWKAAGLFVDRFAAQDLPQV